MFVYFFIVLRERTGQVGQHILSSTPYVNWRGRVQIYLYLLTKVSYKNNKRITDFSTILYMADKLTLTIDNSIANKCCEYVKSHLRIQQTAPRRQL